MTEIPLLKPEDVELRVSQLQSTQYGTYCTLLCYKDARCDQRYLDAVFGPMNWQRSHQLINNSLFCTVEVYDAEKGIWVKKQDVGLGSNTEAVKGECSDSFKRACFNWGIGRELYQAPNIRFKLDDKEVTTGSKGQPKTYSRFQVSTMVFDRDLNRFTEFTVVDDKGNVRFSLDQPAAQVIPQPKISAPTPSKPILQQSAGMSALNTMCADCGAEIKSQRVADFSIKRFHRPLCYSCQQHQAA